MGSFRLLGIMAMLLIVLLPMAAKGNIFDDFLDKVCEQVECGKGSCVVNKNYPLNYICECDSGWKRTQDDDDKYATSFLPCVIPACSLNYSCLPAPAPFPVKSFPFQPNLPSFDPPVAKGFPFPPNLSSFDLAKSFPFPANLSSFDPPVAKSFPFPANLSSFDPPVAKSFPFPANLSSFDPCNWATCGEGTCVKNKTFTYSCECSKGHYNLLNNSAFPCYSSECVFGFDCSKIGIKVGSSTIDRVSQESSASIFTGRFHWMVMLLMSTGMVMWS